MAVAGFVCSRYLPPSVPRRTEPRATGELKMAAFNSALADHVHDRHGVVSDAELRTLDVTVEQRQRMVSERVLIRIFDGVYRLASTPETLEGRCRAICLAEPRAVITGRAAGRLRGLRRMGAVNVIDVRVPHFANTLTGQGIRLRRCNVLDDEDVEHMSDGIRMVTAARLAFDLGAVMNDLDLESVIEQLLDLRLVTMLELHHMCLRLYHHARPGSKRFARVIQSRPMWMKPADSHLEVRLFDALRRAGVRGMVRQHELLLADGVVIHPDIAVPEICWAIEVDHVTWHGGRTSSQLDKSRDRRIRAIGWHVDRVTDSEISSGLAAVVSELVGTYRRLVAAGVP
jgi:very-short-patch-repair endonuclease